MSRRSSHWLFRFLLELFPRGFRDRVGPAAAETFEEELLQARRRGVTAVLTVWTRTLVIMPWHAAAEHARELRLSLDGLGFGGAGRGIGLDIRQALRVLRREPSFSITVLLTYALGIGTATAVAGGIFRATFPDLPYGSPGELVRLRRADAAQPELDRGWSLVASDELRAALVETSGVLTGLARYHHESDAYVMETELGPVRVSTGIVSTNFFRVLGIEAALGALFDGTTKETGVVLGQELWRASFGAEPSVVGRTVRFRGRPYTVLGVLPRVPAYPDAIDVFITDVGFFPDRVVTQRDYRFLTLFGRSTAEATPTRIGARLAEFDVRPEQAQVPSGAGRLTSRAVPIIDDMYGDLTRKLALLSLGIAGVLAMVASNLVGLSLARISRRRSEIAIRLALGGTAGRAARPWLVEWLLITGLGAAGALICGAWTEELLLRISSAPLAASADRGFAEVGMVVGACIAFSFVVGLVPTWRMARETSRNLRHRGGTSTVGGLRLRRVTTVSQVAVGYIVLVLAGSVVLGLVRLVTVDQGFDGSNVLAVAVRGRYGAEAVETFHEPLIRQTEAVNGVVSASLALRVPLHDRSMGGGFAYRIDPGTGRSRDVPAEPRVVTPAYFETIGQSLLRGRTFGRSDGREAPKVAVVNESFARLAWGDGRAEGREIEVCPMGRCFDRLSVVGVVADIHAHDLDEPPVPEVYTPLAQDPTGGHFLLVRTRQDASALAPRIVEIARGLDPSLPVSVVGTLEDLRRLQIGPQRTLTQLLGLFGALGVVVVLLGVGATLAVLVAARSRELALRITLGADPRRIRWMVVREGLRLALFGVVSGLALLLLLGPRALDLIQGTDPPPPALIAGIASAIVAAATLVSFVSSARVARTDPCVVLREG